MKWKTKITQIEDGKETVRGFDLEELIKTKTFTEAVFLIFTGALPKEGQLRMLNALLVAAIDHGVGAPSATTARIVSSCGNPFNTALAGGILALGLRHGGAIEGAAEFFQKNKEEKDIAGLVGSLKKQGVKIAGFGHRVLSKDERTIALLEIAKKEKIYGLHCAFAEAVERELNNISSKKIPLNIDGAMAAILSDMNFDSRLMTGFFAIARLPGLTAHIYEEITEGEGLRRIDETDIEYIG